MAKNYAVKLVNTVFGTVVFDVVQASSASGAESAAAADDGQSWGQEADVAPFIVDPNVSELLSDNKPDITNSLPSNPGH